MKPILYLLIALTGFHHAGFAQQMNNAPMRMPATIFLTDIRGKRPTEEWNRHEIKGSPFLTANWSKSVVTLMDNRSFNDISIRFNCVNNSVHYLNAQKEEMVAPEGMIREILLFDSLGVYPKKYSIVSGYPATGRHTVDTYYEREMNGNAQLLKYTKKKLTEFLTIGSTAPEKEYVDIESFYLYRNGVMKAWEKGKDFLLEILSDKKELIADYIAKQNLKCKTIDDCRLVLNYYNGLE